MRPKLSVVTTVYNAEKFIKDSINSILSQTFSDFEFIILNDGSKDGTVDIIKSYKDTRIRFFNDVQNRKIPYRRNQGIALANTPYIVIHDGDDISLPHRLEETYRLFYNNIELFCIGSYATKIDLEGKEVGEMNYPPRTHEGCVDLICKKCMNPMIDPSTTFRKDVFDKLGRYTLDKAIYTVPDFDLWLKAILGGYRFSNLDFPLIKYRQNPDGMTGQKKQEMIKAHMIVWSSFMKKYRKQLDGDKQQPVDRK